MLHIITPYTRTPEFIERAYSSITKLTIEYHWYIVSVEDKIKTLDLSKYTNTTFITKPDSMPMHSGVNYYYDTIPDTGQWVIVLDDDNLIHENINRVNFNDSTCDIIVVGQKLNDAQFRILSSLSHISVQHIDNGQFIVRRSAVGNLRYWLTYRGDGYFITELKILTMERGRNISLLSLVASNYNAQHWIV